MNQTRKKALLTILEAEIAKAQIVAQKRRATAKHFRGASRSAQGDRRYFENVADLAEGDLNELLTFKDELLAVPEKETKKVKPICFVELEYKDGETGSFYFVQRGIRLPGLQLLTPSSPLGQAIEGKKENEAFTYQIKTNGESVSFSGQIKKIE